MANKTSKSLNIDADMEEALEQALDLDLNDDLESLDVDDALDSDLSLDDFELQVDAAADELKGTSPSPEKAAPGIKPEALAAPAVAAASASQSKPAPTSIAPANDDSAAKDYEQTVQRLGAKSSGSAFATATLLSLLWLAGGAALAHILYAPEVWAVRSAMDLREIPGAIGILVGTIVPIFFIYVLAIMLRRASEMRQTARSMSEIAFRLAAPEKLAEQQVATVGHAVRREVAAMGEGIERTIARATELEAMMQSEVGELERVYTDNELRVRSLLTDLGNEREGIVTHAERLRASISGAHEQLRDELNAVSG
ncbi:MAG: kinesin, partial [Pseudomonadota bacterium]